MKVATQIIIGIIAVGLIIVIAKNSLFTDKSTQFYNDGWTAFEKKNYESSIFFFNHVDETKYPDVSMGLGASYLELKDYDNAILNLQKAYKNKQSYSSEDFNKILNSLGYCYLQTRELDKAQFFLEEGVKFGNPNSKRNIEIVDSLKQIQSR